MRVFISTLALLLIHTLAMSAESIKVLTAGTFKQVLVELIPDFVDRSRVQVQLDNETAGVLLKRIASGEKFDVVVLTPTALKDPSIAQKIDASSIRPLGRVGIAVAVKAGQVQPQIASVDEFFKTLADSKKVAYIDPASGGSSGIYLENLFRKKGMLDQIRAKAVLVQGGLVAEKLVNGEAVLAIHQKSELLQVPGITILGPLPPDIQNYTDYAVALSQGARDNKNAQEFVSLLFSDKGTELIKTHGIDVAK